MLANMANSLIEHKRIHSTVAKAKALQRFVEPLLTKSKTDTTHSRRIVFGYLRNKEAVNELFREIATKIGARPGGYTRVIQTGFRRGDGAETAVIELVDYNELYRAEKPAKRKKTRRAGKKTAVAEGDQSGKSESKATEAKRETEKTAEKLSGENPEKQAGRGADDKAVK